MGDVHELFAKTSNSEPKDFLDTIDFDNLDITSTTDQIDFEEIDGLMEKFKEDPRVQEILEQGLDVREYSQNIEKLLQTAEKKSVEDYVNQQQNLADLHKEIQSCDNILESMESILHRFQFDLGNISDEIRSLQDQSSTMSVKLQNRKVIAEELDDFISQISVPKKLVQKICQETVNDSYLEFLTTLNQKLLYSQEQGKQILATKDIDPELEKLRIKAVSKVREYMLHVIFNDLRKPNTNVQLQRDAQLKNFKKFNEFLLRYGREHAKEIRIAYIDTMQKIYYTHFREYINGLMKVHIEIGSKNDLLGVEENQGKGFFSSKFAKNRSNVFSMGVPSRGLLLNNLEDDCLVLHDVFSKKSTFSYEVLFRSMIFYFKSAVVSEYAFDCEFFNQKVDLYNQIFGKASQLFIENIANYTATSFDVIGILIMIRIAKHYSSSAKEKEITKLALFFNNIIDILKPRFMIIFNLHLDSVRNADVKNLGNIDPIQGLGPHFVTRRYAEFISAIHSLNPENNQSINSKLAALRTQMQKLLQRLVAPIKNIPKLPAILAKTKQVVFFINNADHILSVLNNRKLDVEDGEKWKLSMDQQISSFVDLELLMYFDKLIKFVKSNTEQNMNFDNGKATETAVHFADTYERSTAKIIVDIRDKITNLLTGMEILQQILTNLVNYYTKFENIVRKSTKEQSIIKELVTIGKLSHHIKKCKLI